MSRMQITARVDDECVSAIGDVNRRGFLKRLGALQEGRYSKLP